MICCGRDVDCNVSGDVCCCVICGTWYVYPGVEITPAHAAQLAREDVPLEKLEAAYAQAERSMSPDVR